MWLRENNFHLSYVFQVVIWKILVQPLILWIIWKNSPFNDFCPKMDGLIWVSSYLLLRYLGQAVFLKKTIFLRDELLMQNCKAFEFAACGQSHFLKILFYGNKTGNSNHSCPQEICCCPIAADIEWLCAWGSNFIFLPAKWIFWKASPFTTAGCCVHVLSSRKKPHTTKTTNKCVIKRG